MAIGIIAVIIIVVLAIALGGNNKQADIKQEIEIAKSKVEAAFTTDDINEAHREILLRKIDSDWQWRFNIDQKIEAFKIIKQHQIALLQKYGEDVGSRLVNHQYWIGMTEEQLLDCKGSPDKIEKQVLKTKTKVTYIYGNKSSGDYFVLENGEVVKFVDR